LARKYNLESSKFIDGSFDFTDLVCGDCPADDICHKDKKSFQESYYSNFLNWLFYRGNK
jgi:hypothetical protein